MAIDMIDSDLAITRMVLFEVGQLERPLVRWIAEMKQVDPRVFDKLQQAWLERYEQKISSCYKITQQPLLQNVTLAHMPLAAAMMPELLNRQSLPRPPAWYRSFARTYQTNALGFITSSFLPKPVRMSDGSYYNRTPNNLREYFYSFSDSGTSLPDEKWFDQALQDCEKMERDIPHLLWLAREMVLREDAASSTESMDSRLELFQVPEAPQPSLKTLARYKEHLAKPEGIKDLEFARSFVREAFESSEKILTSWHLLKQPSLYRAAILPRFVRLVTGAVSRTQSVRKVAEAFLLSPSLYSFRFGGGENNGIMRLGRQKGLRYKNPPPVKSVKPDCHPCSSSLSSPTISSDIIAGCLWMIAAAADAVDLEWLLPACKKALAAEDVAIFNRLVATVGLIGTPDAIRGMVRLRARVRHATMFNALERSLAKAAAASGLTTVEAEELLAQEYELDSTSCHRLNLPDGYAAVLSITGSGQGSIYYEGEKGDRISKLPPFVLEQEICKALLKSMRSDAKAISADMLVHRYRLERSWLTGQTWTLRAFIERWLNHPLLGWLARRQIWLVAEPGGSIRTCLFGREATTVYDPDGNKASPLHPDTLLSLWHPLQKMSDDCKGSVVARWRETLERLDIRQPIRQVWRETYTITQAERESSPSSYRYAQRILGQAQVIEIGRKRGWRIRTLTAHIPSSEGAPWSLIIPAHGIYAEFRTGGVGYNDLGRSAPAFTHVMTDRVRFCILKDRGDWRFDGGRKLTPMKKPVRLADIDQIVFSEVMRDLDLMVSVAASNLKFDASSIQAVPELGKWRRQQGLSDIALPDEPHYGGLAQSRRQIIEGLLPSLQEKGPVTLDDRHVIVTGRLHQYRIHLGSGEVIMVPQYRHLTLETLSHSTREEDIGDYQPLYDDDILNSILYRIALLQKDHKIRDKNILEQLRDE
ncbi:DUF4132 domain-containing protein [Acetobacter senegalensis]|nr:DUF4132 domain-containing protein [Acetobacter senegalensis]